MTKPGTDDAPPLFTLSPSPRERGRGEGVFERPCPASTANTTSAIAFCGRTKTISPPINPSSAHSDVERRWPARSIHTTQKAVTRKNDVMCAMNA